MKGNVGLYELNTKEIVKMLEGQLMPNPASTLASMLAITYVGSLTLPKDWLKSTFRVRRRNMCEALLWLKENNSLYGDICIDEERLRMLPEDGIPEEVLSLIRQEVEGELAEQEEASYVSVPRGQDYHDERSSKSSFSEFLFKKEGTNILLIDNGDVEDSEGRQGEHGEVIPLQFVGVEDVDLNQLSSNELLLHALANLRSSDSEEGGYAVRHGRVPIFNLPIVSQDCQSTTFNNDFDVFAAAFPVLWLYGEGRWDARDQHRDLRNP